MQHICGLAITRHSFVLHMSQHTHKMHLILTVKWQFGLFALEQNNVSYVSRSFNKGLHYYTQTDKRTQRTLKMTV